MNTTYTVGKHGDIIPPSDRSGFNTLSRCHLSISTTDKKGLYRLIDLNSTNHCYFYEETARQWEVFSKVLIAGDMPIRLGDYKTTVDELLRYVSAPVKESRPRTELYLTLHNQTGQYRAVLTEGYTGMYYWHAQNKKWEPLSGAIISSDTRLRLGQQETTVAELLQKVQPYRNVWGEICYSFTI